MNDQLEQDLVASFDRRAAAPVDTSALAIAAGRRGRRLRVRVYATRGLGVVAVAVAGVVGVTAVLPGGVDLPVAGPPSEGTDPSINEPDEQPPPGGWKVPGLRVAEGVPGAADAAQKVGADPAVLHFTVDDWLVNSSQTTWSVRDGSESIAFHTGAAAYYQVGLARSQSQLDALRDGHVVDDSDRGQPEPQSTVIAGKPGTLYVYGSDPAGSATSTGSAASSQGAFYLRWQPIDGVWAQVYGHGKGAATSAAFEIASKLRLDSAYRCAAPVQLTSVPNRAKLLACQIALAGGDLTDDKGNPTRLVESQLTVGTGANRVEVSVTRFRQSPADTTTTIAGHPARQFTNNLGKPSIKVPDFAGVTVQLAGTGSYNFPALIGIAEGIVVADEGRDLATWPTQIIG